MNRCPLTISTCLAILILSLATPMAFAQPGPKPKRARLPKWSKFPSDVFFKDAFREGLVGPRPATLGGGAKPVAQSSPPTKANDSAIDATSIWSQICSAETLEDEIKSLHLQLQKTVTTPGKFSGGGYQEARWQFTELATLFAVVGNYDGKVRWKKEAPSARDRFARAAANAKVSSIQAFNEAKQRKDDLEELIRGGTLNASKLAEKENDWQHICDRRPLMKRIEKGYREGLEIWAGNVSTFSSNLAKIKREAELLKLFGIVLTQEGLEDAGDADYDAYCKQLVDSAEAMLQAVRDKDPAAGREANSAINKSCIQCHEDYRG